jgi:hypothetical protein
MRVPSMVPMLCAMHIRQNAAFKYVNQVKKLFERDARYPRT